MNQGAPATRRRWSRTAGERAICILVALLKSGGDGEPGQPLDPQPGVPEHVGRSTMPTATSHYDRLAMGDALFAPAYGTATAPWRAVQRAAWERMQEAGISFLTLPGRIRPPAVYWAT